MSQKPFALIYLLSLEYIPINFQAIHIIFVTVETILNFHLTGYRSP